MNNNSCQNAGGQGDALARQAMIDKIDCHGDLRKEARQRLGDDCKNAALSELRAFLMAHNVKE